VQVGPEEVKQVITGLQKHVPVDELLHKKVVVILNLKVRPMDVSHCTDAWFNFVSFTKNFVFLTTNTHTNTCPAFFHISNFQLQHNAWDLSVPFDRRRLNNTCVFLQNVAHCISFRVPKANFECSLGFQIPPDQR
jgi:hypothetical protein